jgi:small subunit ribosomal protein S7
MSFTIRSLHKVQPLASTSFRAISISAALCDVHDPKMFAEPTTDRQKLLKPLAPDDPRNFLWIKTMGSDKTPVFYRDYVVDKLARVCMMEGKKELARWNVLTALETVKRRQYKAWRSAKMEEEKAAIELDPFVVANKAVRNCRPLMKLLPVTRGGTTYQVPFPMEESEAEFRGMKLLREACRQKAVGGTFFRDVLASELIAASKNEGMAIQSKQELHKLCEANRAFAHYRG